MTLSPSQSTIAASAAPADMLDALLGVFSAKGFEGASLAELSRSCGRSKASLYHHFPGGKAQMIEVLVGRCVDDLDRRAFQLLKHTKGGGATSKPKARRASASLALEDFLDGFISYIDAHDGHCLLATLALTQPDLLGEEHRSRMHNWLGLLATPFEHMGNKPKAARRLAQALLARLYGSLTIAAMGADVPITKACKWLKKDLLRELDER